MFFHNLKYTLKTILKNKALIFWTLAFPIILGTLFHLAFSDIEKNEQLKTIEIAIVENDEWLANEIFQSAFHSLSQPGENKIFEIQYVKKENAQQLLEDEKIVGYLELANEREIHIKENGINETIFKYVVEEIKQQEEILKNIVSSQIQAEIENNPENINVELIYQNILKKIEQLQKENPVHIKDTSSSNLSYTMIEYYTLIAMACLYGGILGLSAVHQKLANMSTVGKRASISPTKKGTMILSSVIASYIIQIIGIAILFAYTIIVLKVDYGTHLGWIIILTLIGCLAGLTLGIAISCILKTTENTKTGLLLTITMLGCFLSGMMGITMKYIIDKNIPFLNQINPANLITDGFYSLYYYETMNRFYQNLISLILFSIIMIVLSILSLRRQKYDNL